jgi:predicted RNase H-like HicB family nuclease
MMEPAWGNSLSLTKARAFVGTNPASYGSINNGSYGLALLSLARELSLAASSHLSVALETNGRGFHGFIVELPGAFVRGATEEEAQSKAQHEAASYLAWLGRELKQLPKAQIVQTHRCNLMVEDADCEILLDVDRGPMSDREFQLLVELATHSGVSFTKLYEQTQLKDWVDEARIRKTFYGGNKKTIKEIFDHVKRTQYYYLSRTRIAFSEDEALPFMELRQSSLDSLALLFIREGNSKIYNVEHEEWTLKKILRRFVWHDRIHGKAITRILEKQRKLGLIDRYEDPFRFEIHPAS